MLPDPQSIVDRLIAFQAEVRDVIRAAHRKQGMNTVAHTSQADTIYAIDADVDPILIEFCERWGREQPLVLIAEGIHDEHGIEGPRIFPAGTPVERCELRLIVDPIDGTRQIMYDKRSAWALAGVAPNKGDATLLSDVEVAVMTELPTSKLGQADVLWAIKGQGARGERQDLKTGESVPLAIGPSQATTINHGYASVSNFFPGTKVAASELMEFIAGRLIGPADITRATVFDDQYISSGGQLYELIVGHDRFNCDLRRAFYDLAGQGRGLCVHPYDVCTLLIAREAGVIVTDGFGKPVDAPLDCLTDVTWAGFANAELRDAIEPLIGEWFASRRSRA